MASRDETVLDLRGIRCPHVVLRANEEERFIAELRTQLRAAISPDLL